MVPLSMPSAESKEVLPVMTCIWVCFSRWASSL